MDGLQVICTVFVTVVAVCAADHEFMVSKPGSIMVAMDFEAKLECEMNIIADTFQWKFYPLKKNLAYNPKAEISLTTSPFQFVPSGNYTIEKKVSVLTLQADSTDIAGDYQCLAYYGAVVVASVPWRVTFSTIRNFPPQDNISVITVPGNTVNWRCDPPDANPEVYVDYFKNGRWFKSATAVATNSLILTNVSRDSSGVYTCQAGNVEGKRNSSVFFSLTVVPNARSEKPRFIVKPKTHYQVSKGDTVFLECASIGNPPPKIEWRKEEGVMSPHNEITPGGLIIRNVHQSDAGVYKCTLQNQIGYVTERIRLEYTEPASIICPVNTTEPHQGENLDLDCEVRGFPKPEITWFLNGFVVTNDTKITTDDNRIFFNPIEKRHAGRLQIFARNPLKTVDGSIFIKVIPLTMTQESSTDVPVVAPKVSHKRNKTRKNKHGGEKKLVPPNKPVVSRVSDEAVMVRWTVNPRGLPVQFFKVQFREVPGSVGEHEHIPRSKFKWDTDDAQIDAHIRTYEVRNLKPDRFYRFRISAVYSNNDNRNSPNSERFFLKKMDFDNRNPLPVPMITDTEPVNSTSVKIYWKCDSAHNITDTLVEGFYVNYISASSAADYMKATVEGADTDSYVLSHLQPDTVYDIKLQSFTSKSASQYSYIRKVKTLGVDSTTSGVRVTSVPPPDSSPNIEGAGISKLYIFIAAGVLGGCACIFVAVGVLMLCRKWKQKKNNSGGDDRHTQSDPKNPARANGCVSGNRMTITANPLADADNKNQNMIEMSSLSSQNNNCSTVQQPSVSGEDSPTNSRDKISKKRIRDKRNVDSNTSGENFV